MSKQALISLIVIIAGVAGLVWWSKSAGDGAPNSAAGVRAEQNAAGGFLSAEETLYDFGTISMQNGNVSKIFRVANSSDRDIKLESVTTSCMCTNAYILNSNGNRKGPYGMPGHGMVPKVNEIIKAGETREIEVVYDPNAHGPAGVGRIDRFIWLVDETGNKLELEIKANVTP